MLNRSVPQAEIGASVGDIDQYQTVLKGTV